MSRIIQLGINPNPPICIGVTLGWDALPTRVFRWQDGSTGIYYGDRRSHPEAYDETGWPIDRNGQRLLIYDDYGE